MRFVAGLCHALLAMLFASAAFAQTSSGPWRSIGPDGGSILAIVTDPVHPNIVHVGTDGGGVFRSTDNGITWRAARGVPVAITRALAIAPSHHLVVYAGTNNNGIFKSVDGGASWSPTTPPHVADTSTGRVIAVDALAVDPRNAAVVYAATRGMPSVLYKTTDGGVTWSPFGNLTSTQANSIRLTGLRIDPVTPDTMYGFGGVIVVKSVDAGRTWVQIQPASPGLGFEAFALALDPVNPSTLYTAFGVQGLYKSTNGGQSWTSLNAALPFVVGPVGGITLVDIAVDPRTPQTIYVAAMCRAAVCPEGAVYKSTDGGVTWTGAHAHQGGWNTAVVAVSHATPAAIFAGTQCGELSTSSAPFGASNSVCKGTLVRRLMAARRGRTRSPA